MTLKKNDFADSKADQIALTKRWVETWRAAGEKLERIRRRELRELDSRRAIRMLCGPADYTSGPRAPKSYSGLVEQQRWFAKAAHRE
jgi:hypothetical protein